MEPPMRSEAERQRQQRGDLRVRDASAYRHLVQQQGLEHFASTDVVGGCPYAALHRSGLPAPLPGDRDPRIRHGAQLGGVSGLASGGSGGNRRSRSAVAWRTDRLSGAAVLGEQTAGGPHPPP